MPRKPIESVNAHLRSLAGQVAAAAGDLMRVRALIDEYSHVDPSVLEHGASVKPVRAGDVPAEWLLSPGGDPDHRLMYVHGGSWLSGTLSGYRAHAGRLAEATASSVLNIGYRLAPENPFPAGLTDCDQALDWLMEHGPEGRARCRSLCVAGDSAGGNLVLALLIKRRDLGKPLPDAAVVISPATDLSWSGESIRSRADLDPVLRPERLDLVVQVYLQGQAAVSDAYVSPLCGDLGGLSPLLVQVGENEILLDDAVRFAAKAASAGVAVELDRWPGMPHVFQMFAPYLPEAGQALEGIGEFVNLVHK
jgi:acetyl esterase/lipase